MFSRELRSRIREIVKGHLVLVDDQAKFSQKAVGQAGSAQRGEQLLDGLLSSFPHAPTPGEQDGDGGLMEHPAEEEEMEEVEKKTQVAVGLETTGSIRGAL